MTIDRLLTWRGNCLCQSISPFIIPPQMVTIRGMNHTSPRGKTENSMPFVAVCCGVCCVFTSFLSICGIGILIAVFRCVSTSFNVQRGSWMLLFVVSFYAVVDYGYMLHLHHYSFYADCRYCRYCYWLRPCGQLGCPHVYLVSVTETSNWNWTCKYLSDVLSDTQVTILLCP